MDQIEIPITVFREDVFPLRKMFSLKTIGVTWF